MMSLQRFTRILPISVVFSLVSFAALGQASAQDGSLVAYPRVPGDVQNEDFPAVTVNGTPVETCGTAMNTGYAHFAFSGTARVEITAREEIETFDLSPHRSGIKAEATGKTLSFELSEPRHLHLQVNQLTRFFLFADGLERDPVSPDDEGVFDLTAFGVTSSEDAVQTADIQRAIDEVAAKAGVLMVPPGIYRTGELRMKDNLTLHVSEGAILKGTGNLADHPEDEFGTQFIHFIDCENVRIRGRGVIDAQGRALRISSENASASRSKLIRTLRARKIVVEDVILRDSGTWGAHLIESEDLRFTNCKLFSNTLHDDPSFRWDSNTDGFDPDNSSRILIERCFVSTHDDAIAVKLRYGTRRDMSNIVFRDNTVWTVKSALKIGTEVFGKKLSNVRFENNDVIRADRGISVYAYAGGMVEDVAWIGNHFEFIGGDNKRKHLEIKLKDERGKGALRDLLIKDNTFEQEAENPSLLDGLDADHQIEDVVFENHVVSGRRRTSMEDAAITTGRFVRGVAFR